MKKNLLITGGTGFIGLNITEYLLKKGWNIVLYARKPLDEATHVEMSKLQGKLYYEKGDILDQNKMEEILYKYQVDCFIHGAAITPDKTMEREDPTSVIQVNCIGLMHSFMAAKKCMVKRFIYLGSISAYGKTACMETPLNEGQSQAQPHSLYELSKFTGERLVIRLGELYGIDAYVARIGDVYGPWEHYSGVRGHMSLIYQTTRAARNGESVKLPRACFQDWVSGMDIAGEIEAMLVAEKLNHIVYPLCSGVRWSLIDWCELLKKAYPKFSYQVSDIVDEETIEVNQSVDNAPMSLKRLTTDTGYLPIHDSPMKAFDYYMEWLDDHFDYLK